MSGISTESSKAFTMVMMTILTKHVLNGDSPLLFLSALISHESPGALLGRPHRCVCVCVGKATPRQKGLPAGPLQARLFSTSGHSADLWRLRSHASASLAAASKD